METTFSTTAQSFSQRLRGLLNRIPVILIVLVVVLILIALVAPTFYRPVALLNFLKRAAPIMVVAVGQMYVMLSGEFDLSVGSLITVCAAVAANVINNDPNNVLLSFVWVFGIAILVGLINGLIVTRLNVPSFVTTLGMLLVLQGAISIYTRGAPQGGITDNFRIYGRGNIEGTEIPYAFVIMLIVIAIGVYLMHFTTFGRRIYAVGGNPLAARLSGVNVGLVKTAAFVLSAVLAAVGAILIAGFSGVSSLSVGQGYEFQSISAIVLGGIALGGGRGNIAGAVMGALTLQAMFSLLNFLGFPLPIRLSVQGLIIVGAVAIAAWRSRT
ncbi:MAG: ABC transporter permease [Anaerolineae bacterium]|nr:ABC transporter permease [Anaerolineae bacterium]